MAWATRTFASAGLLVLAALSSAAPAEALPGNVNVGVYYPTSYYDPDVGYVINASSGETTNFTVWLVVSASNSGFRSFTVHASLRFEIVDVAADFAPAEG